MLKLNIFNQRQSVNLEIMNILFVKLFVCLFVLFCFLFVCLFVLVLLFFFGGGLVMGNLVTVEPEKGQTF